MNIPQTELPAIFAAYWGADVNYLHYYNGEQQQIVPTLSALMDEDVLVHGKLLLTPLEKIRDEDAMEVAMMKYPDYARHASILIGRSIVMETDVNKIWLSLSIQIIDYLRSPIDTQGNPKPVYDLGYLHIKSLIEAKVALDETLII